MNGEEGSRAESLASRLGRLPLAVTRWPPAVLDRLKGMGVTTIGECLKLPRDGFARRVGSVYLDALDKSLGKCADPRAPFKAPEHLDFVVELFDESTSLPIFIDAVTRMTEPLARELQLRQAQVGMLQLTFEHRRSAPTVYRLELLEGTSHGLRLLELLCDKLERIALPAPATALRLTTGPLEPAVVETGRLFKAEGSTESGALVRLVERLRGRLGESGVHGLTVAADHRPERAWAAPSVPDVLRRGEPRPASRSAPPDAMPDEPAERPLWLSLEPEPLRSINGRPHLGGQLRVIEGPERIESGWHDGKDIGRDYFIAVGVQGEKLWVFRDHADGRWYLHGRFG